ncbi:MAG: 3-oxoacyl-[acyl-carrier-protein] synthase III C-terminal domain-containing protein [Leptospiraceae bacterium]|nr:3-oxoacyl-[acyl-carrier-protein] synthase III C-terminal domain-containing protein [Leptospiraceae bacterium]
MYIHSVATAIPSTVLEQEKVKELARELFADSNIDVDRLIPVFENAMIESRPVCMPIEWYSKKKSFKEKNEEFLNHSLLLAKEAALAAMEKAKITSKDIHGILVVTSSGFVTPTLDARLMDILQLESDIFRLPLTGLGCAGGVYGLSRARELSNVYENKNFLLIAVETCTITFRPNDKRKANLVALSLFSDGAAAVIISSQEKKRTIRLEANHSYKWNNSLDVMGWDVEEDGLQVVFDRSIPDLIEKNYLSVYTKFLNKIDKQIQYHLYHPGGKKVLDAIQKSVGLEEKDLKLSSEVLRKYGNLSSPTVLFVLEKFLSNQEFESDKHGILSALGPGFSCELNHFRTT